MYVFKYELVQGLPTTVSPNFQDDVAMSSTNPITIAFPCILSLSL